MQTVSIPPFQASNGEERQANFLVGINCQVQAVFGTIFDVTPDNKGVNGFVLLDFHATSPTVRPFTLPNEIDASSRIAFAHLIVCPQSPKLACIYEYGERPPTPQLVPTAYSYEPIKEWVGFYVTDMVGENRQYLGYIPVINRPGYPDMPYPLLAWSPDGKHLSFIYDDMLWVMKV